VSPAAPSLRLRLLGVTAAALVAFLASPGIAGRDGSLALAVLAVALWALTAATPLGERPWRARAVEWLGGGLAGGLLMWWVTYVVGFGVVCIGAGWGVYAVAMGALLRRLAPRVPFALAVALAWTSVELVRSVVPPPFGLGWFRVGHYPHAHLWLSGSARVIGVEGLTFVVAALGGGLAALVRARRAGLRPRPAELAWALGPLALAVGLVRLVPAPATIAGPRVLLVQPGFTQKRKQHDDSAANVRFSRDLTHRALAEVGPVDLVCWGESMLYIGLFTPGAEAAVRAGKARLPPWLDGTVTAADVEQARRLEEYWVERQILGLGASPRPFPDGAAFAVGVEYYDLEGPELRRRVGLVLYDSAGGRSAPAFKRHMVPLGETFFGLERFERVRDLAHSAAGYLPDFLPGATTGVLPLRARDGRTWHASATVCFDNAHVGPYVDALRHSHVDFHLVASNEAWYETSCEMDQMVAFSRTLALLTGRAFVRATNSGVSCVIAPDGRELGRVRGEGGADRAVAGYGAWDVPVPLPGNAVITPYVRWGRRVLPLALVLTTLAAALRATRRTRVDPGG
jgi:apolipoprotein N-acyltransferase